MTPTTVRTKTYLKHAITGSLRVLHLPLAYRHVPSPYPFHTLNAKLSGKKTFYILSNQNACV